MCGVPIHPLRRIPAPADRARPPRRGLRADRGSGRGEEARRKVAWCGATSSRLVTPGTLTEDTLLDARRNNYLLAVARARGSSDGGRSRFALAWIDISTGEFRIAECDRAGARRRDRAARAGRDHRLRRALRRSGAGAVSAHAARGDAADPRRVRRRDRRAAADRLFRGRDQRGFGTLSRLELTAAAACVTYVERTQLGKRPPLSPPLRESAGRDAAIDAGDARQPRTHAHARRRAARLAARGDRPHRDGGGLAAARAAARRAADRCRRDRAAARRGRRFRRRRGRCASRLREQSAARARPGARAGAARGRPRRPARPRRDPRRHWRRRRRSPRGSKLPRSARS